MESRQVQILKVMAGNVRVIAGREFLKINRYIAVYQGSGETGRVGVCVCVYLTLSINYIYMYMFIYTV